MNKEINLIIGNKKIKFNLNDSQTASGLETILPLEANVQRWGNEIYFSIPLEQPLEEGTEIVKVGDIAYWPPGQAFCLFFGKTPASTDDRPRATGPVTVVGHISDIKDIDLVKEIKHDQLVRLQRVS